MGDKNYKWYVASCEDAEVFDGMYDTREEALAEGRGIYAEFDFVLIEADRSVVKPSFDAERIAERILEDLEENNPECWGEDGVDDGWNGVATLEEMLEKAVTDWLLECPPRTFCVDHWRNLEHINKPAEAA